MSSPLIPAVVFALCGLLAAVPLEAAEPKPPAQTSAAMKAVSFAPMPRPSYIEVKLRDDAPENVQLAWQMHRELERRGLLARSGPTLRLTLETESAALLGDEPPAQASQKNAPAKPRLMGIFRAVLTDAGSGARLWEAEAVYDTAWGDLAGGAVKLVPALADAVGQSVERNSIVLR